ncbi:hypothetical protein LRP49_05630 [Enterovibrio sp. ZSDZ35]|uniref:Phage holin, LL-H family n=1 Tax=Enterovibrio qingdaonensis TaxID=2899818 RepID=A0ABT5QI73_9GAMM|nr:hypothetical protein [Enterovibrio sp. ZSDZ35]MDD1780680.1 hypothetical protein [Enterovibrio sp. ZSDZ35]
MEINTILAMLGGLGVGSLLNTFFGHVTTQKAKQNDRRYEEKKAAHIGLLNALHDAAVKPSNENSKAYALWQTKCQIFGSSDVSKYAQEIVDTNDCPRELRDKAFNLLLDAIRKDLNNA